MDLNKEKIREMLEKGKRIDNRELLEYRNIKIETDVVSTAEGSAIVKLGDTEVIAGVKIGVAVPYTDSPEEGTLIVSVELLPLSSPDFEPGPPNINAIETARIVDRGIRESEFIDFKKLCLKKGELVHGIFVDIYSLNYDGNLIDASALAAVAALKTAFMPKVDDDKVVYGEKTKKQLPMTKNIPITLTFVKIGNSIMLDPSLEEWKACDARFSIAINPDGKINAVQKGESGLFSLDEIKFMIDTAIKKSSDLRKFLPKD